MDTVHECDRQTDGRTDGRTDRITITNTVQRIASHGKNNLMNLSEILKPYRKPLKLIGESLETEADHAPDTTN